MFRLMVKLKSKKLFLRLLSFILIQPYLLLAENKHLQDSVADWGWQLPVELSDKNTTVSFEVDSTWHLVQGTTAQIFGRAWLTDSKDPLSVRALVEFPVEKFNTNNSTRDERMREVMDSKNYPNVRLEIDSLRPECTADDFIKTGQCQLSIATRLTIHGNQRLQELSALLERKQSTITVTGTSQFSWLDFAVEDPSIFVAKLEPQMKVTFSVSIPADNLEKGK